MKIVIALICSLLVTFSNSIGQTLFRSNGTGGGNWTANATWQQSTDGGASWVAALSTPTSASGFIDIRTPDVVSISAPLTINGASSIITIENGATLTVSNTLTLGGANPELTNNGTLSVTGAGLVSSPSAAVLINNATYTHGRNGGTIPTATWSPGSFCNVTAITNTVPAGLAQSFDSFSWNCTQTAAINLAGNLTTINADFTISNTGGFALELATTTAPVITIGNNLSVSGNSILAFVTSGSGAVINVGGDFSYNSTATSPLKTTGAYTLNVTGNFNMNTTGTLRFSTGAGVGTMNLNGNFTLTAGTLTRTGGSGSLNFNGTGIQTFTNTGTMSSTINITVASTSTLDMQAESPLAGGGTLTVNGTLRLGSVANASGALINGAAGGNIRVTGVRTYNAGSRIVYAGLSAQIIGNGQPAAGTVITEIDNTSGVSFTTAATGNSGATIMLIPSDLILTNGDLNIVSTATVRSLTLNGNVASNGNNITISGANTDLVINGSGPLGTFPFPSGTQTFRNLTFNRTSSGSVSFASNPLTISGTTTINNGTVTLLGASSTLTGNITLATGTVLAFDGQQLITGGTVAFAGTGAFSASGASTLTMNSAANITSALAFLGTNNTLQSFTMNYTNANGTVQIPSALNVTQTVTITAGKLSITGSSLNLSSGSTLNRNSAGSVITSSPSGGPWNLVYSGATAINPTGLEIPSTGNPQLLSLTSNNTNTVTLGQSISVGSGGITINSGTFNSGANAISSSSLNIPAGTFTAPSSTLTLTGNLSITGTYTNNSGTLIFNGNSNISNTATNFFAITINASATLTAPAALNIQSNFSNSGIFNAGTNTVNFTGANVQTISGTSNTSFYNLLVNKGGGSLTVNSTETIANNLTLTAGTVNISSPVSMPNATSTVTLTAGTMAINSSLTLASGATVSRAAGTFTTNSPSVGPWNLIYTAGTKTTGLEIPASGNVLAVTLNTNNATTVTLAAAQPLNVSGSFTITNAGRTFTSGANNVTVGSLVNSGTFNAPTAAASTGLTLNGNFTNNSTFNNNGGTVVIGGPVTISGTIPTFFGLTVNASGTFTAPAALTIQGNFQNDGSFVAGSGTVTLSGNTSKNIQGASKITFNNLTISGNGACQRFLENTAGADLTGVLTLTSVGGNPIFDTDGASNNRVFTLLSTNDYPTTADASISTVTAVGQMPGKVTVQRYMGREGVSAYNYQVWRNISSPVNTTVSDLQNSLPVTGPFAHASVVSGADATYSSMERYDETVTTDTNGDGLIDLNDGWTDFPISSGDSQTTSFVKGNGYSIFIYGSDPPVLGQNNAKWSLTGPIWSGNFNLPVTFTSTGNVNNDGWNLVGNPYPATINWNSLARNAAVDNALYMSDYRTANPVFASYVNGVSTNGGTNLIAIGQGFWVKANAAGPALSITEAAKVAGTQTVFLRQASPQDLLRVTLSDGTDNDETVIYFSDSSTVGFDKKYDAWKFRNPYWYLNLSSLSPAQENYSINAIPFKNCAQIVPLNVYDVTSGNYSLSFSQMESFSSAMKIQLQDNFTSAIVDVRQSPSYQFTVDQNNAATFGSARFSLTFTYQGGNLPLVAPKTATCDSTQAVVTIKNSSSDFNYSVLSVVDSSTVVPSASGIDSDLTLSVPKNYLVQGANIFQVKQVNKYCATFSAIVKDTVSLILPPAAPLATSSIACGKSIVTLTASGVPKGGYYNWYDSSTAVIPYTNQTATFITPQLVKSRWYYLSASNSLGCEGVRDSVMAKVIYLDSAHITVLDLFTLQSSYSTGNQWYLNGQPISGATSQNLKPTQSGSYTVQASAQGCTTTSIPTPFVVTGLENSPPDNGIKAYPNPVKGILTIEAAGVGDATGEVFNALGSGISTISFENDGQKQIAQYNFRKESSGVYFVRIIQGDRVSVVRIVKD